ncbi:MAG TPA: hypothetical protein VHP31_00190, partial [Caproicibacter sp.]|nr:hypothetical protein [Caproicibacter sp.]
YQLQAARDNISGASWATFILVFHLDLMTVIIFINYEVKKPRKPCFCLVICPHTRKQQKGCNNIVITQTRP